MEYYLCRAMEVSRLTEEQLRSLQSYEKKERYFTEWDERTQTFGKATDRKVRCLYPHEIQDCFKLCTLKEHYGMPEVEAAQSVHNQRLRVEFKKNHFSPKFDLMIMDISNVHEFDDVIREADRKGLLNLHYQGGVTKRRVTDGM